MYASARIGDVRRDHGRRTKVCRGMTEDSQIGMSLGRRVFCRTDRLSEDSEASGRWRSEIA